MEQTKKIIPIACDHAGFELKQQIIKYLTDNQYDTKDYGTFSPESVDYPDMVHPLGRDINNGVFERGIVICGTGNGVQMTVNKYPNVRCALCWIPEIAALARQHNNANVLAMPARFIDTQTAIDIVKTFLDTDFEGGRHQRRVEKINKLCV
ncbi:MAG: ribose 5-phosphate isomerase B [Bacteroidales bacterium]|nr:ribose 5-phosphate isomerase B [Bacteroidales bacterium]